MNVTEKLTSRARRRWRKRWNRARRRWPFRSLLSWDRASRYATTINVLRVGGRWG